LQPLDNGINAAFKKWLAAHISGEMDKPAKKTKLEQSFLKCHLFCSTLEGKKIRNVK
jgi:hypothetical protein